MSLNHFTHYEPTDCRWHAVYRIAGDVSMSSIGNASTKAGAAKMANEANAIQHKQDLAAIAAAVHPADRRIPAGFYSDSEAA